ncbi:S1 domain-containing RNA-binding protein [Peribacillus sp. FSL H8-0477]|uniref:S1 domain-containing RNA-binding protein n=1 Tax=Peribacillus sp. FSL H8-0477 TaxID=2921388 RepID=UPI0030FBF368
MSIEVGSKVQGKVTGITKFGAFVELSGGSTGLVHISEVADKYVKDINDYLKIGDQVEVKVLNVEKDGKIGLSIKKAIDKPEEKTSSYSPRPRQGQGRGNDTRPKDSRSKTLSQPKENFEQKMTRFLKDSEDLLTSLKRNTETKRGGRGGRRG